MSARDELEAAVWQRLRRYKAHVTPREMTADVDAILAAAGRYAQDERDATEHRAELARAIGVDVHWQHPERVQHQTACSSRKAATTAIRDAVTCRRCMATNIWKAAA